MITVCHKFLQNKKVFISLIDLLKLEGGEDFRPVL